MTAKNLAIVWAPNLFRAPPVIDGDDSHLLNGLDVHTSLCCYLITNSTPIFVEEIGDPVNIPRNLENQHRNSGESYLAEKWEKLASEFYKVLHELLPWNK
ncbi:hypothetical protein RB195_025055 [Necator americanus]|uniref:Rho-GAP domain-containing protein n=1 Tax=Necator americanus TaxID=51031 RepID=A0ABR1EQY0_NECAM